MSWSAGNRRRKCRAMRTTSRSKEASAHRNCSAAVVAPALRALRVTALVQVPVLDLALDPVSDRGRRNEFKLIAFLTARFEALARWAINPGDCQASLGFLGLTATLRLHCEPRLPLAVGIPAQ